MEDLRHRVTRNDVAKLAGVSPAVVSYVINNSKYVSDEKKKAVLDAIQTLQYRPNLQARSLKTQQSMQLAFVCDNLRNDWLEISEKMLFDRGYYVSHCYSRDGEDFIQMLIARRFDGVFMMSNRYSTAQLNEIAGAGIPVVLYRTRNYGELNPNIVTVVPDLYDSVFKSVSYLALKGHRRIALLLPIRYRSSGINSDGVREKAYVRALEQCGLEAENSLICTNTESMDSILQSVFNLLTGDASKRPTAIIAGNDWMAGHVIQYIKQLGLRIPEDVAVMGEDNTYLAEMTSPTLTSVDFSKSEFAADLTETMLELIAGRRPEDIYLPVSVVVREST